MLGLSKLLKELPELIFPRICVSCGSEGSNLCFSCNELWLESPKFKNSLLYSFPYANKQIRGLIRNWKYHFEEDAFEKIASSLKDQRDFLGLVFKNEQIDFIVPVVLHWQRRNARGFDQAILIAEVLSEITNVPVLNILKRNKSTKQQARKARHKRSKVDSRLFSIRSSAETPTCSPGRRTRYLRALRLPGGKLSNYKSRLPRHLIRQADEGGYTASLIKGKNICLVDDVWTTGATMKSASMALKSGKPGKIIYYSVCQGK